MSVRNEIALDIVAQLRDIDDPRIGFVTRDPSVPAELANSQFPCITVELLRETRLDESMRPSRTRSGTLEIAITGYVQGVEIDQRRNTLIEAIEDRLEQDRKRDNYSKNARITGIELQPTIPPYGQFVMSYEVFYTYTRGES